MKNKNSKFLWILLVVAVIVFCGYSFLTSDLEHIEDTNGPDNYALTTITDENIINQDIGALNVKKSTGILNDGITFSSNQFTGVYQVFQTNFLFDSVFLMDIAGFVVNEGNFKMAVVNDGEIIATVEPGLFATCDLSDLNGSFALVIAGESADFEFTLDRLFCEQYDITVNG